MVTFEVPLSLSASPPGAPPERINIWFTRKPVGFDFHNEAPITVDSVFPGSHAAELGVQKGWIVRSIQGEDMDGEDFKTKFEHFAAALTALPGGTEVVFRLPDGSERAVLLRTKPVGFDFHPASPIVVDDVKPKSQAAELGIQKGWKILRINGYDLTGAEYEIKHAHLVHALSYLPSSEQD